MAFSDTLISALPAIGTVAGGPVGGAVGGLTAGLLMGADADKQRREYDRAERAIPLQDPAQVSLLDQVRRDRKALRAGTDPMTSYRLMEARNQGQQTAANIARNSGGSTGALQSGLMRVNDSTNRAIAGAGAIASQRADNILNMEGSLVNSMADRLYQRQLSRANLIWGEYARRREDGNRQALAALGLLPQLGWKGAFASPSQREMGRLSREAPTAMDVIWSNAQSPLPTPTLQY